MSLKNNSQNLSSGVYLPQRKIKCPCCNDNILIPYELIYNEEIEKKININNFFKLFAVFTYIQIYCTYEALSFYEMSDLELSFIAYMAHEFNFKEIKTYLQIINYEYKKEKNILNNLFQELLSPTPELNLFFIEKKHIKFHKNFLEKTCIKDNIKIYSILIFIRHKTVHQKKLLTFDQHFIKCMESYFLKTKIPMEKYRNSDHGSSFYHVGKLITLLNLNYFKNNRIKKKKKHHNSEKKTIMM